MNTLYLRRRMTNWIALGLSVFATLIGLGFLAWEVRTPDDVTVASGFDVAEIVDERIVRLWTVLAAGE